MRRKLALLGGTVGGSECLAAARLMLGIRDLIQGRAIRQYEAEFARRVGVRYAYSFSAGRVGLYGILKCLAIGQGSEVLLSVPTHVVVPNAIRYTGARPVYVDCRREDFNIDLSCAAQRISPSTKAIVLQHTFGEPADIPATLELADRHGLVVIEDCVHALGASYRGRPLGSFGHAAFFSTEETKTISTTMGGMVVTDDEELAHGLRRFQAQCSWPSRWLVMRYLLKILSYYVLTEPTLHRYARAVYEHLGELQPLPTPTTRGERHGERPAGFEQRLSNAQATIGLRQLARLDENVAHRRAIAAVYDHLLKDTVEEGDGRGVSESRALVRYPLLVSDREEAIELMRPWAVPGTWFSSVLEEAEGALSDHDYVEGSCPSAEYSARHLLNLPTHPRVRHDDARAIARAVTSVARANVRTALTG